MSQTLVASNANFELKSRSSVRNVCIATNRRSSGLRCIQYDNDIHK